MNIKIPNNSKKYILFQRTGYLHLANSRNLLAKILYRILRMFISYNSYVKLESFFLKKRIEKIYEKDMFQEYLTIKNFLPVKAKNILDIGCGVAGIDVFISKHYENDLDIYLLDKTEINKEVYYNYKKTGSFYNSQSVARELLILNEIPSSRVFIQETKDNRIDFKTKFDLIISLISWGFHYPISVYLDQVFEKMAKGAVLIVDVRVNTEGEQLLRSRFDNVEVIMDEKKFKRFQVIK